MSYNIGSFNLRDFNLSKESTDDTGEKLKRNFDKIADIIVREKFDVMALQEINSEFALNYLVRLLNKQKNLLRTYESAFGEDMPIQKGAHDPERYGFIWNAKRLRLIQPRRGTNPSYYQNAGALGLIRPPYYARFSARGMFGGTNFELRVINTHIKDATREEDRIKEFDVLVKQVLPRICDHQEISENGETMPSYTFLMGDYNLALNKSERAIYKIETVTMTSYTGKTRGYRTVQEEPTTLKLPNCQTSVEECYANNYDHFTYEIGENGLEKKLMLFPQRVEALTKYYKEEEQSVEKLRKYRTEISDHVPIKLTIDLIK